MPKVLILSDLVSPHTLRWVKALHNESIEVAVVSFSGPGSLVYPDEVKLKVISHPGRYNFLTFLKAIIWANLFRLRGFKTVNAMYAVNYGLIGACVLFCNLFISVWGSDVLIRPRRSIGAKRILRFAFSRSKAIFATSKVLVSATRSFTNKPIFEIPFGVDVQAYRDDALSNFKDSLDEKQIKIACVKWLKKIYGQDTLLRAIAILKRRRKGISFKIFLTGDGPDEMYYRQLSQELGLSGDVEFTGRLTSEQAIQLQKNADIAIYPSLSESFGVSILESICYGNITLGARVGGIPEIIEDKENGLLFEPNNPEELADKIDFILCDKELQKRLLFADIKSIASKYEWTANKDLYIKIIKAAGSFDFERLKNQAIYFDETVLSYDYVFHYPGPLTSPISGRPIRLISINESLNKRGNIYKITGHVESRYQKLQRLRFFVDALQKDKPLGVYSESHTNATPLVHGRGQILKSLKTDYALFHWAKKEKVKLSVYIRDAHWQLDSYKHLIWKKGLIKRKVKELFHYFDFFVWGRYADKIYIPNEKFVKYIPRFMHFKTASLAPGTSPVKGLNVITYPDLEPRQMDENDSNSSNTVRVLDPSKNNKKQINTSDVLFFNAKDFPLTEADLSSYLTMSAQTKNRPQIFVTNAAMKEILHAPSYLDSILELNREIIAKMSLQKVARFDPDRVNIMYCGGMGELYPIENYIRTLSEKTSVHIYMCVRKQEFMNLRDKSVYDRENITLLFDFSRYDVLRILPAIDFGLLAFDYREYLSVASPIKFSDYLSGGCPILSDKFNGVSAEISEHNIGICIDLNELESMSGAELKKIALLKRENVSTYAANNTWDTRVSTIIDDFANLDKRIKI